MLLNENIPMSGEQNIKKSKLLSLFETYIADPLKAAFSKGKTKYADCIVRNSKGQVLLLQRAYTDDSMNGKWGFPGGHVDEGESFEEAAIRELCEETGLKSVVRQIYVKEQDDCIITYFEAIILSDTELNPDIEDWVVLDVEEHRGWEWCDISKVKDYDLVANLNTYVDEILSKVTPITIFEPKYTNAIEQIAQEHGTPNLDDYWNVIQKSFDNDQISEEQYFEYRSKYIELKKAEALDTLSKALDEDLITEEEYLQAIEKARVAAPIGTRKMFGGREYIKTVNGWKFHGKGRGTKAQEHVKNAQSHPNFKEPSQTGHSDEGKKSAPKQDEVKKKERAKVGDIRTFAGREYIKTEKGWRYHGKGTGKKAQEYKGQVEGKKEEPTHKHEVYQAYTKGDIKKEDVKDHLDRVHGHKEEDQKESGNGNKKQDINGKKKSVDLSKLPKTRDHENALGYDLSHIMTGKSNAKSVGEVVEDESKREIREFNANDIIPSQKIVFPDGLKQYLDHGSNGEFDGDGFLKEDGTVKVFDGHHRIAAKLLQGEKPKIQLLNVEAKKEEVEVKKKDIDDNEQNNKEENLKKVPTITLDLNKAITANRIKKEFEQHKEYFDRKDKEYQKLVQEQELPSKDIITYQEGGTFNTKKAFMTYAAFGHTMNKALRKGGLNSVDKNSEVYVRLTGDKSSEQYMPYQQYYEKLGQIVESTIEKSPLKQDVTLFRGISGGLYNDVKIGEELNNEGFVSSSTNILHTLRFAVAGETNPTNKKSAKDNHSILKINAKKGQKALPIEAVLSKHDSMDVNEVVMQKNTKFKVTGFSEEELIKGIKTKIIHVDVVNS